MNEIRLTFRTGDFGAVSQMLVDMGVSFRVEPLKELEPEAAGAPAAPSPGRSQPRAPARKGRKPGPATRTPAARSSTKGDERHASAADRLREAIIRNQAAGSPPPAEAPDRPEDE